MLLCPASPLTPDKWWPPLVCKESKGRVGRGGEVKRDKWMESVCCGLFSCFSCVDWPIQQWWKCLSQWKVNNRWRALEKRRSETCGRCFWCFRQSSGQFQTCFKTYKNIYEYANIVNFKSLTAGLKMYPSMYVQWRLEMSTSSLITIINPTPHVYVLNSDLKWPQWNFPPSNQV